ncbi:MAG TPA: hypothetical protein PK829_12395 [Promineifilum sp.]|nr:hypothetical protein [Promineifilum sp.]
MAKHAPNPDIYISTEWADAGYDCDHCGGRILRRTDHETGLRDHTCLQCEQCRCQWTLARHPLRVGTTPACRAAQRRRAKAVETLGMLPRWMIIVLAVVVVLALARFGGVFLRLGAPAVLLVVVAAVVTYRRRRDAR